MKTSKKLAFGTLGAMALMFHSHMTQAAPLGSTFTYQGRLNFAGAPALDGLYDFRFALHSDAAVVSPVGSALTLTAVPVTNGLFTVPLDFPATPFTSGEARWLQLEVRTNGVTSLVALTPRQRITPTPQALYAGSAATATTASSVAAGAVTSAGLAAGSVGGAAIADGSVTSADLNASLLNNTFWKFTGNTVVPGQFLGSTNNQSVEIRANGFRALRLEPRGAGSPPNLVGGYHQNIVNGGGSTIAGGGTSGALNQTDGDYGFIGAGIGGSAFEYSMVGAGAYNSALGSFSMVGAGIANTNRGESSAIVAGTNNTITALANHAFIGGGRGNISSGPYATVPGGSFNVAAGQFSFAAGNRAKANHHGSFVWADSQNADVATTTTNQFLIRARGGVGIGTNNPQTALHVNGTVTAAGLNWASSYLTADQGGSIELGNSFGSGTVPFIDFHYGVGADQDYNVRLINNASNQLSVDGRFHANGAITAPSFSGDGAGLANVNATTLGGLSGSAFWKIGGNAVGATPGANVIGTTDNQPLELRVNGVRGFLLQPGTTSPNIVGGGFSSVAAGLNAVTIGGGQENNVSSSSSTIAGGFRNVVGSGGQDSTIGGGQLNVISNNTVAATVAGGTLNVIGGGSRYAAIAGGRFNRIQSGGEQSTIGGGRNNVIDVNAMAATIAGGTNNLIGANSHGATVAGGINNQAAGSYSTIGGGQLNTSSAGSSTVGGGLRNTSSGGHATVSGGFQNTGSGTYATVGGGEQNTSAGGFATVGGGLQNASSGPGATVGGGYQNISSDYSATVPGGEFNTAGGRHSFAAGFRAKALHNGAFVWADEQLADFASTGDNQFAVRASGGVRFATLATPDVLAALNQVIIGPNGTSNAALRLGFHGYNGISGAGVIQATEGGPVPLELNPLGGGVNVGGGLAVNGIVTAASDTTEGFEVRGAAAGYSLLDRATGAAGRWSMYAINGKLGFFNTGTDRMALTTAGLTVNGVFVSSSDRNMKQEFAAVNARAVLEKVAQLRIQSWTFKNDPQTRHIGPMAQDFHAAFNVGMDDKHIATVDADGVALAAIQGLNQKVAEQRDEIAELKQRLGKLEQLMNDKVGGAK